MRALIIALIVIVTRPAVAQDPPGDRDRDGIPDSVDKCPNEPEDKDGFQDDDGCPDPDNDGDGVPDATDQCPTEMETKNGYKDDDGCRDEVPKKIACRKRTPALAAEYPDYVWPTTLPPGCKEWVGESTATVTPAPVTVAPTPGASQPAATTAPTGYRCGPGGKITIGKACTCAADRIERRDSDGVSVCAKQNPTANNGATAAPMGKLVIKTKPTITAGASWADRVSIDNGRSLGQTPITTDVPAGTHTITYFRAKTTVPLTVRVPVKAGITTTVELGLE